MEMGLISTQGTSFKKASLEFADEELVDID